LQNFWIPRSKNFIVIYAQTLLFIELYFEFSLQENKMKKHGLLLSVLVVAILPRLLA